MITFVLKQKIFFLLFFFVLVYGLWARVTNLSWGYPYFFHPDENNIIYAISNLQFPFQMNPHFFAYGSFPMYSIYLTSLLISKFHAPPFEVIAYVARAYSAILSIGIIFTLLYVGKKIWNLQVGIIASLLASVSVGFIQYAHFGTFEMWLSFLSVWFFYFWTRLCLQYSKKTLLILGILLGLLIGTKVSLIVLLPLPFLTLFLMKKSKAMEFSYSQSILIYSLSLVVSFLLTNPFVVLDFNSFWSSIHYEGGVAVGSFSVFYTQSFQHTIPVVFQFLFVYPFLLNPFVTVFFLIAFIFSGHKIIKQKNVPFILLTAYFLILFLSQAFFFVKWTRYIVPTLPFIYLFLGVFLTSLPKQLRRIAFTSFLVIGIFYSFAYLHTTFLSEDTRLQAAAWVENTFSRTGPILTEPYDLGILPFNQLFPTTPINLFNFYSLDTDLNLPTNLSDSLSRSSLIILPSQRVMRSRLKNPTLFPKGENFYNRLFHGSLGFRKVYQTPCDMLCTIIYNGDPIFHVEETVDVFERPTVFIFAKK